MRTILRSFITAFIIIACTLFNFKAAAQIGIPSAVPVTENFNSMGATLTLPANWRVSPPGNTPATYTAGVTTVTQQASSGTSTTSGRYNWATTPATDRAVGFMTDGSYASPNAVMAFYRNTTGSVITSLTISFQVERYRINNNAADISFSSSRDGISWASQPGGDIGSGVFTTGASDFLFALPTTITRTVTISGFSLANNADYYLRWVFTTGGGTGSQGLGLDDVSVTATTIGTTTVAATLNDALTNDVNANTYADPGDRLTYTAVITNTGANPAANATINPTAPANTTLSGVAKTSALAADDNFTNAQVGTANVLTNDFGLPSLSVVSFGPTATPGATTVASNTNGTTNNGGTVKVLANGTFTYTAPGGFTGLDQFAYVATTGTTPNDNAIVTIAVGGPNGVADAYSPSTNLSLTVAAPGVLANDGGGATSTVTAVNGSGAISTALPTVKGGMVTVQANGGFTYNPPAGYTGNDEFTYTLTNAVGSSNAVVTLTIAGSAIWFVNNNAASNGNGTLGSPFKLLSDFQAVNDGAATHPKDNDVIFLYESATSYIGPVTLRSGQKLVGQDASASLATIAGIPANPSLPAMNPGAGNATTITSSGVGITLNSGNTIRGLTVAATTNAKISGTGFGTLTLGNNTTPDVIFSGNGQIFNLTTGSFGTASGLISAASTSSTTSGMTLTSIAGTLNFGSTAISAATSPGISVASSTADLNFGNTTITATTGDGVALLSNSAGTRTFGTLTITVPGGNIGFNHSSAGGITTITGATIVNNSTSGTGAGISISGATSAVTFAGVTVNKSGTGTAISLNNASGTNAGNVTFTSVTLGTSASRLAGQGINIAGTASIAPTYSFGAVSIFTISATAFTSNTFAGTINVTSGTLDAASATALSITGPGPALLTTAGITLTTINSTGGTNNISISNCSGTINCGTGALSGASATSFSLTGGTADIIYAGTISQTTASQLLVNIFVRTGGTVTLSGNLSSTGTSSNISVGNNSNTTINFSGTTKTLSGTGNRGVTLTTNPTSQVNFTNGGLAITNTTNSGFDASGGGTVTVTGANNTITTTTGTALNLANVTVGSGGMAFQTVSANGATNGISLATVTGTGSIVINGGTITGGSGAAVSVSGGSAALTYSGGISQATASQPLVSVVGGHTGTLTFNTGTLSATNGTGLQFDNADGTYNFNGTTTLNGGDAGIDILNGSGGSFTFGNATSITSPSGTAFNLDGGSCNVSYTGNITKTNAGALVSISGGHTGNATFQTGTLNATAGTGLQFDNADGGYIINGTATLNGGDAGIDILNGSSGNFTFGTGVAITNPTGVAPAGTAFYMQNSNASGTYSGSITDNSGFLIDIDNHDLNTFTFQTGNLTSTAQGIRVQNCGGGIINFNNPSKSLSTTTNKAVTLATNTNSTINFGTSGLVITTTTAIGFDATAGGTINVTGTGNTITSGTGTALNVANTTIGASNLNFQSISANGGANGIVMNTTGSGALNVTGTGSAGSGGTIQNTTGKGILLNTVTAPSFNYMNITGSRDDGIDGTNVNGFSLTQSNITNSGTADEEHGIEFLNLSGSVTISNTTVRGSFEHNFKITNTSGTLSSLNVTNCTFDHLSIPVSPAGGNGFLITMQGTAVMTNAVVNGCTFRNNFSNGVLVNTENTSRIGLDNATSSSTVGFKLSGSTFDDNNIAIQFGVFNASDMTVDIQGNTIFNDSRRATSGPGSTSHAIVVGSSAIAQAGSSLNARIDGNLIGATGTAGSGSSIGSGIRYIIQGLTASAGVINNNTIREAPSGFGIEATFLGPQDDLGTVPASYLTVTNNNVDHRNIPFSPGSSDFPLPAIYVAGDNQAGAAAAPTVKTDIRVNTVPTVGTVCGSGGSCNFLGTWIEVYEYTGSSPGILELLDTAPANANATAQLQSTNTGTASANAGVTLLGAATVINLPPDL